MKKRKKSKWGRVHNALGVVSGCMYELGLSVYVKDYDIVEFTLNKQDTKVGMAKHTGFTIKNRNK